MEVVLCLLCAVYLIPFIVAARTEHARIGSVLALNLALGWTGIGWIAALWWAARPHRPAQPEPTLRRGHLRLIPGGRARIGPKGASRWKRAS